MLLLQVVRSKRLLCLFHSLPARKVVHVAEKRVEEGATSPRQTDMALRGRRRRPWVYEVSRPQLWTARRADQFQRPKVKCQRLLSTSACVRGAWKH